MNTKSRIFQGFILIIIMVQIGCAGGNKSPSKSKNEKVRLSKTDVQDDGFKGSVKQYRLDTYKAIVKSGKVIEGDRLDDFDANFLIEYDQEGYKTQWTVFHGDGGSWARYYYKFKFDEFGNKISGTSNNTDGSVDFRISYKYDGKGNVIEASSTQNNGDLINKVIYKYDSLRNPIEWKVYKEENKLDSRIVFKYDASKFMTEQVSYKANGSLDTKITYKNDSLGNPIEWTYYNSDGSFNKKYTFKYEYDSQGNWVRKTLFSKDSAKEIEVRKIEYYSN